MFRLLTVKMLLLLLLVQSLSEASFYLWYKFEPNSFTERFCVNQDKPELKCNGKCQLKKIRKTEDNEPFQLPKFLENLPKELLFFYAGKQNGVDSVIGLIERDFCYSIQYSIISIYFFWHPPD